VKGDSYSCDGSNIELTLGNNGLFSIDGIIVQVSREEGKEPTVVLGGGGGGGLSFRSSSERIKEIPSSKIISKYGFDGNTRDSKSGNNGVFCDGADCTASPEYVEGMIGEGISFDGTNDYVNITYDDDSLDFGVDEDFSISGWVRIDPAFVFGNVINKGNFEYGGTGYWIQVTNNDGSVSVGVRGDTGSYVNHYPTDTIPNNPSWHHVAVIFDRDTGINAYVDSIEIAPDPPAEADRRTERSLQPSIFRGVGQPECDA